LLTTIGIAIAGLGTIAGLFTAGAQAVSTASQVRGTATERDKYRQKSETVEKKLADTEKRLETVEGESRRKDLPALGLMILLGVAYNQLLEAQTKIAEQEDELARKDDELAKKEAELARVERTRKNILLYGVPAVVLALVLVFSATKHYYSRQSIPAGHVTTVPQATLSLENLCRQCPGDLIA
jgi:hypothetical protein